MRGFCIRQDKDFYSPCFLLGVPLAGIYTYLRTLGSRYTLLLLARRGGTVGYPLLSLTRIRLRLKILTPKVYFQTRHQHYNTFAVTNRSPAQSL